MSYRYLGKSFDIHGGGKDLIFPHHENEIAQSEAAFGQQFVRYWVHNGFVDINNEKMSKSLGNFTMIKDVLERYHPEVIRLFLLSKHYRSPIDYNEKSMDEVVSGVDRIYAFLERALSSSAAGDAAGAGTGPGPDWEAFREAMDDDFNTARGIATVFDVVKKGNRLLDENAGGLSGDAAGELALLCSDLRRMGKVLGILTQTPQAYFAAKKRSALESQALDASAIDALVRERTEARKARNFARADEIRAQLEAMKVVLEDAPGGTTWKIG
jgi:cysteinyl-tRNA synthetase